MKNTTVKLVTIYLVVVISMLIFAAKCSAQNRKPTDSVLTEIVIPSYVAYTYAPVYRDTLIIRDTVVIRDTVYVTINAQKELIWSRFKGTFQQFVDSAAKAGLVAYIDKPVMPAATVQIPSNITIEADTNVVITNIHKTLFQLSKATGRQVFKGLRIVQDSIGVAFSRITFATAFYDSLHDVHVTGGLGAYESSRGGTESQMAITAMRDCKFNNSYINISAFSQDGPYRALHLYNVQLNAKTSHNIYVHPATSLFYDSVACLYAGKLMQHQYSGSFNGGYNTGKYSVFNRVYSGQAAFEMTSLANESSVIITNSNLAPYVTAGIPPALVYATKSNLFNAGNGIFIRGVLDSCTGGVWSANGYKLEVNNSRLQEFSFRGGGISVFNNTIISNAWGADRGQPFDLSFRDCTIGNIWDGGNGVGTVTFIDTKIGGSNLRTNVIK